MAQRSAALAKAAGDEAERFAETWLQSKGFKLMERQLSCRFGEIDLVMRRRQVLALIEVKYRADDLSAAISSVSPAKQRRLSLAARWLYAQRPQWQSLEWRFDVLALAGNLKSPEVQWLPAAFELLGE